MIDRRQLPDVVVVSRTARVKWTTLYVCVCVCVCVCVNHTCSLGLRCSAQVLTNLALELHQEAVVAFQNKNATQLRTIGSTFLGLIDDVDSLAAAQDQRLIGSCYHSSNSHVYETWHSVHPTSAFVCVRRPVDFCCTGNRKQQHLGDDVDHRWTVVPS